MEVPTIHGPGSGSPPHPWTWYPGTSSIVQSPPPVVWCCGATFPPSPPVVWCGGKMFVGTLSK